MTQEQRFSKIREIVAEILEIDPTDMSTTSLFKEDHDADSLRSIEILASLEKEFNLVIPQDFLPRMTNLQNVYDVCAERGAWA